MKKQLVLPLWVLVVVCLILAGFDIYQHRELTAEACTLVGLAVLQVLLLSGLVESAGILGSWFNRIKIERLKAEEAAAIAQTYLAILSSVAVRGDMPHYLPAFCIELSAVANSNGIITAEHMSRAYKGAQQYSAPLYKSAAPDIDEQILRGLEVWGIVEVLERGEDLKARIIPEQQELIKKAFPSVQLPKQPRGIA